MAPALTQTADPPILADTPCHSPTDGVPSFPLYVDLKKLSKRKSLLIPKEDFEIGDIYLSNGDSVTPGLAPPASCWAEGSPVKRTLSVESNMDVEPEIFSVSNRENDFISHSVSVTSSRDSDCATMGLETRTKMSNSIPLTLVTEDPNIITPPQDDTPIATGNQSDLLALVGRDFNNVNEIIDTLQRLASNPQLLDATARDLDTSNAQSSVTHPQTTAPETKALKFLVRLNERQRHLQRRRVFLLRRLRRVTSRGLVSTVSSQLGDVAHHVRGVIDEELAKLKESSLLESDPVESDALDKESLKNMSTSDLISLVRRVEASSTLQRSGDEDPKGHPRVSVSSLSSALCDELDAVTSEMRAAASTHLAYDSDATESSSGGESCDEDECGFRTFCTNYKPIRERAFYKYCRARGWVASRWMWLQAQVADLDYRILQQQKLLAHIKKTKGAVKLRADDWSANKRGLAPSRDPSHADVRDPALTCIGSVTPRPVLNGFHPSNRTLVDNADNLCFASNTHHDGCARTVGVERFRRRRYVRPAAAALRRKNLAAVNAHPVGGGRGADSWFISACRCIAPLSCILCVKPEISGRHAEAAAGFGSVYASTAKTRRGALLSHSLREKRAKFDPMFHPVLSRPQDILQSEALQVCLKKSSWDDKKYQKSATACSLSADLPQSDVKSSPTTAVSVLNDVLSSGAEAAPLSSVKRTRKSVREHRRNGRRRLSRDLHMDRDKITLSEERCLSTRSETEVDETDEEVSSACLGGRSGGGSGLSSPCHSPAFFETKADRDRGGKGALMAVGDSSCKRKSSRQKQNSTSNSYDINNIVIPSVMAPSTRVEHLKYKEIPTPEWRILELSPLRLGPDDIRDIEDDISEECMKARHCRSEEAEKKKFLSYQKLPGTTRACRPRRADSSGTNTPDNPMSPRSLEPVEVSPADSPLDLGSANAEDSNPEPVFSKSTSATTSKECALSSREDLADPPDSRKNADLDQEVDAIVAKCADDEGASIATIFYPSLKTNADFSKANLMDQNTVIDRLSPFPCREFPLNESEYRDLVYAAEKSVSVAPTPVPTPDPTAPPSSPLLEAKTNPHLDADSLSDVIRTELEAGHATPLSELTDSAPEEDTGAVWDEREPPHWTISAMNDDVGGLVLAVQKN